MCLNIAIVLGNLLFENFLSKLEHLPPYVLQVFTKFYQQKIVQFIHITNIFNMLQAFQDGAEEDIQRIKIEDLVATTLESNNKQLSLLPEVEMAQVSGEAVFVQDVSCQYVIFILFRSGSECRNRYLRTHSHLCNMTGT